MSHLTLQDVIGFEIAKEINLPRFGCRRELQFGGVWEEMEGSSLEVRVYKSCKSKLSVLDIMDKSRHK